MPYGEGVGGEPGALMQIFLSYASEDKAVAEPIAFSLRARGHKVFLDRDDLPAGGEYDQKIEQAVAQSGLFVFLISPQSVGKGRFTLSELEFARRKWLKPDGHVLPVMVAPTRMEDVPSFLKSVTILEPKGNVAAEVASAVDAIAASTVRASALLFAGAGIVSGALTKPLMDGFESVLPFSDYKIADVPLSVLLAGIAFAVALAAVPAFVYRFKLRQLLMIAFVLAGWFLALETFILNRAEPPEGLGQQASQTELDLQCAALEQQTGERDPALERKCIELKLEKTQGQLSNVTGYWNSVLTHGLCGAIGAFVTALGVPFALRRRLPVAGFAAATAAGIVVAVLFYVLLTAVPALQKGGFYMLFMPWQAAVAAALGRFVR